MSAAPHWPFCLRLGDGSEILFRPDDPTDATIHAEMVRTDRAVAAADIANFIGRHPGTWLHGDVASSDDAERRASIDSTAIIVIMDLPKGASAPTSVVPHPELLVFDEEAFLGSERPRQVLRRALVDDVAIVGQMSNDIRAIRDHGGYMNEENEKFYLAGEGWSPDQIEEHYATAALLETSLMGGAA